MACFVVVKHWEDEPDQGQVFGPFLARGEAEDWAAGLVMVSPDGRLAQFLQEEHTVDFVDVDDFVAFGEEVN